MNDQNRQVWPEQFSERFHIFALGESFDVDAFLANSPLRPDFIWRRMRNGPTNGFEILLGDAQKATMPEQEKIAVTYLTEHRDELLALANFPGVEALNLGLVYDVPLHATGFCLGPPRALMIAALNSGVRPNYYGTLLERNPRLAKANEQYAYLTFTGDFDPQTITDRLRLSPTETWQRGSLNERTMREHKFSRWSLHSRLDRSAALEDHIRDVLNQAESSVEAMKSLGSENRSMQAVGYFRESYPGFNLDKETIAKLAQLGLEIDCDFYFD